MSSLTLPTSFDCPCGKTHRALVDDVVVGRGVLSRLPELLARYGAKKPFLLADPNTWAAAGETVSRILTAAGIPYASFIYPTGSLKPDEHTAGAAFMRFDPSCDLVIGIGSGVINDTGKLLSCRTGRPYFIVGTAPSMDGFASATSSMECGGVKISLPTKCADVVIGDTDVLKTAPERMLSAGIGDMIAKYVSLCEWRISHIITGEYYCPTVAGMVRDALRKCVDHADGLMRREDEAVEAVFEGLVLGGVAMNYAGLSRPASGVEHYFSHIWDMRALEFGTPADFHGIQCAAATRVAVALYAQLRQITPDRDRALAYNTSFDRAAWNDTLRRLLGSAAEPLIELEKREGKYDVQKHAARLETILSRWDEICRVMDEELPDLAALDALLDKLHIPASPAALGLGDDLGTVFLATGDIRDKYVLSRLVRDLGLVDTIHPKNNAMTQRMNDGKAERMTDAEWASCLHAPADAFPRFSDACRRLAAQGDESAWVRLREAADSPDVNKSRFAFSVLLQSHPQPAVYVPLVEAWLYNADSRRRTSAMDAVVNRSLPVDAELILDFLSDGTPGAWHASALMLIPVNPENRAAVERLFLRNGQAAESLRVVLAEALLRQTDGDDRRALVRDFLSDPSPKIRVLGCLNASPEADADLLRRLAEDPDGHVRKAARQRTNE